MATTSVLTVEAERGALHDAAQRLSLMPFWSNRAGIELVEPRSPAQPFLWRWKEFAPLLRKSAEIITIEESERRVLLFANPGLGGKPWMTSTIYGGYQVVRPGESAPCHRHTPSASRFVIEGSGAFTTLEGERCVMSPGDLIITPNWTWHDHGNDAREDVIWMDVLDVPLVEKLDSTFFELRYEEPDPATGRPVARQMQTLTKEAGLCLARWGAGGITPAYTARGARRSSPLFVYPWEATRQTLERLRREPGSPCDGVMVEFTNPETGGPAMPTLSFNVQLLRPSEQTAVHRHTASAVYSVVRGHGVTEIGGTRFEWSDKDVFALPGWQWHHHVNLESDEDAILYSVTDAPVLRALDLYREQSREE